MDMSKFIIARSDQLNADDLAGGPITVTIERVTGNDSADQPVSVHYVGDRGKPYKPCKSMRRVMVHVWGKYTEKYVGESMTLYRDPEIQFGGMKVGGIRISHMSGIDSERSMALNEKRGKKALYKVLPLKDAPQLDKPGSIVTTEMFKGELADAAEKGTAALERAWKASSRAPLREHVTNEELEGFKLRARNVDNRNRDTFDDSGPATQQTEAGGGYEGA
jgi:hypothetical protein